MASSTRKPSCAICEIVPPQVLRRIEGDRKQRGQTARTQDAREVRADPPGAEAASSPGLAVAPAVSDGVVHRAVYDMKHDGDGRPPARRRARGEGDPEAADDVRESGVRRCGRDLRPVPDRVLAGTASTVREWSSSRRCTSMRGSTTRSGTARRWCTATGTAGCSSASPRPSASSDTSLRTASRSTPRNSYEGQSGALNESFSDVFRIARQAADPRTDRRQADWLIGEGILGAALPGRRFAPWSNRAPPTTATRSPGTWTATRSCRTTRTTTSAACTSTPASPTARSAWRHRRSAGTRGRRRG